MQTSILPGNAVTLAGQVRNPATESNQDGAFAPLSMDRQGAQRVSDVHGRWYAAAARGNLFISTTLIAGVTIPAPATTLASKAGIRNPAGSGVNVELVALGIGSVTIEVALKQFVMEFQINATATGGAPTSITDLTAYSLPLGAGSRTSLAKAYSAATMTNAAANPIVMPIFRNYLTAVGDTPCYFPFNGEIVFGPDTVMAITNTAALLAVNMTYIWAEWPI
jgi:hypothetical protein